MGQLALDADVYKRLSTQMYAARCYGVGDNEGSSRTQLIFSAQESCETLPDLSQRLAPILQVRLQSNVLVLAFNYYCCYLHLLLS